MTSWSQEATRPQSRVGTAPPLVPVLSVVFTREPVLTTRRALAPGHELSIGRSEEAGLPLRDGVVSRKHATLLLQEDGNGITLVGLGANGTFLNGWAVTEAQVVDGDVLRVGDSCLVLRMTPLENDDAPVAGLVGDAPSMRALRRTIQLVGPTAATALVLGESGTGKELVARALHDRSGRSGPFVAVNCGAIPETLAESQLFGHVAGSFTGARTAHDGFFRAASGGTLFLDEIGELPPALQPKLLRAIEEKAVVPVGATRPVECDVRLLAATHQDLQGAVEGGRFRGDLFARLAEIVIRTPPLRERREDILPLLATVLEPGTPPLSPDLVEALLVHPWPFNVRELMKVGRELAIRGAGKSRLELEMVGGRLSKPEPAAAPGPERPAPPPVEEPARADRAPAPTRDELVALLREHGGNISALARATGRSRRQIHRYLEAHGLDLEQFRG